MNKLSGVPNNMNIDNMSESRLWKVLDSISDRLSGIETKLSEVVRLEEKVKHHDETLRRYGNRLDRQDGSLHELELWQANTGDGTAIKRLISNLQKEVDTLSDNLDTVSKDLGNVAKTQDINKGQKDIGKEVLKWVVGILGAILAYKLTRG